MDMVEHRIERVSKLMKGDKSLAGEVDFLKRLYAHLESGNPARSMEMTDDEKNWLKEVALLSSKPVIYACNMSEEEFSGGYEKQQVFTSRLPK